MRRGHMRLISVSSDGPYDSVCGNLEKIFRTHPCLFGFTLISTLALDIAEATNDWLLLSDISSLHQGLVYGPINPLLLLILLLTTGIGTLMFVFEIANLIRNILRGKPWLDPDLVSCLVIWLTEMPLLSMLFAITMCHSEPVSYFQLMKALLVIISVLFRIINPIIWTYLKRKRISGNEKFRNSVYKVLITIGSALLLCGSATIFIFTHVISTDKKLFEFRPPQEIWGGKVVYETYFKDVGIYFNHFDLRFMNKNEEEKQWIRFSNIQEFFNTDSFDVKFIYTESGNFIDKFMLKSYNATASRYQVCYKYISETNKYTIQDCKSDFILHTQHPGTFTFKFLFIRPTPNLIIGNIEYNARYKRNHICETIVGNSTGLYLIRDNEHKHVGDLLYLKPQATETDKATQLIDGIIEDGNVLFNSDNKLIQASDTWKTGLFGCDCTGRNGPKMNADLQVSC